MEKLKKITLSLVALPLLLPIVVQAQSRTLEPPGGIGLMLFGDGTATGLGVSIINLILALTGLIAVAFLIYGGMRYITSAGNDEVAESAKKTIQNAIIGLVVVILSYTIVTVIVNAVAYGRK